MTKAGIINFLKRCLQHWDGREAGLEGDALPSARDSIGMLVCALETEQPAELWVVGLYRSGEAGSAVWSIKAVCDSEEKAVAACVHPYHFIMPITLNDVRPDEHEVNGRSYYPLANPPVINS